MNPLPLVDLRKLTGLVSRVHDIGIRAGFSAEGAPVVAPALFVLRDTGGPRLTGIHIDGLPAGVWDGSPAAVLEAMTPQPGIPADFVGAMFTFEAWFRSAPVGNADAIKELLEKANRRQVYTMPDKVSARISMAYAVDGTWVQFMQLEGASQPTVSSSASAETNHDHYKGWHMSSVCLALAGLVNRIQADIDSREVGDDAGGA